MSYRFMRVMVFFDLPTVTASDRREYSKFRRNLIKSGFLMMQESVYTKIALNQNVAAVVCNEIKKIKPPSGTVQVLVVTENQFSKIETVVGSVKSDVLDSDERVIIL